MKSYTILVFVFMVLIGSSQSNVQFGHISNGIRTNVSTNLGCSTYSIDSIPSDYYIEDKTHFSSGYCKGLWLGGIHESSNEFAMAAITYNIKTRTDFQAGPLNHITGVPLDTSKFNSFNKIWKFSRTEITELINKFKQGTLEIKDLSEDFISYPAKGNGWWLDNQIRLDFELAPFFDRNMDGKYEPLEGDYPIAIEENPKFIPFEFDYCVFNDKKEHEYSYSTPLGMEIQQTNYVLTCENNDAINNTVFTRLKYKYLSQENLHKAKLSLFEDRELGCRLDDYFGCDTLLNTSYMYNAWDGKDNLNYCNKILLGIDCEHTAMRSTVILNNKLNSFIYMEKEGDFGPQYGFPSIPNQFSYIMNGYFIAGIPMTYGGNGFNPMSSEVTSYCFPDYPMDSSGWSKYTQHDTWSTAVTVSNFDLGNLNYGDGGVLDFADVIVFKDEPIGFEIFDNYFESVSSIKNAYKDFIDGGFNCNQIVSTSDKSNSNTAIFLYPNPSNGIINITYPSMTLLKVFDLAGSLQYSKDLHSTDSIKLNVSNYKPGLYLLQIVNNRNEIAIERFVKN